MYQYLVTTTTVDDIPQLVVIGHYDPCYRAHVAKYQRISYCFGRSTRVAKSCNIAIVYINTWHMSKAIQLLSTNPFHTFDANMRHINLHAEFPEVFI